MRVTIKDIAERTQLSTTTVSLVLNNKNHRLSEKTRQKVLKAVEDMNYRPNQLAVSLITKTTRTIGLIVPDISSVFFGELAKGAEAECQKRGYSIILCNTNDNPQKDIDYTKILLDRGVDGIIFAMSVSNIGNKAAECLEIIKQLEKPVVLVDRNVPEFTTPCVLIDHELGGYLATKHLLTLGHRKIGCITGPMGVQSSKQRFFGYIRALQEFNISFDTNFVEEGDYHTDSGYSLSLNLIRKGVTAIFACNDMMAYGVYKQAINQNMGVPKDLSIVGFDNIVFSEIIEVPLTTVNQPVYELGNSSVTKIIEMITDKGHLHSNIIFKPDLVIRKSTRELSEQ